MRERACRVTAALDRTGIRHAVAGGNAIAAWVARVDVEAVRNTKDVDLLVRREDFQRVIDVGLIDENWCGRFAPELVARLRELIESQGDG